MRSNLLVQIIWSLWAHTNVTNLNQTSYFSCCPNNYISFVCLYKLWSLCVLFKLASWRIPASWLVQIPVQGSKQWTLWFVWYSFNVWALKFMQTIINLRNLLPFIPPYMDQYLYKYGFLQTQASSAIMCCKSACSLDFSGPPVLFGRNHNGWAPVTFKIEDGLSLKKLYCVLFKTLRSRRQISIPKCFYTPFFEWFIP